MTEPGLFSQLLGILFVAGVVAIGYVVAGIMETRRHRRSDRLFHEDWLERVEHDRRWGD